MKKSSNKTYDAICSVLAEFVGETGLSEGALDVVERISAELKSLRQQRTGLNQLLGLELGMYATSDHNVAQVAAEAIYELKRARKGASCAADAPIPMRLRCPSCGSLHVDKGDFAKKPHHTHACQQCGEVWRPAVCATVGVRFLPGFNDEGFRK